MPTPAIIGELQTSICNIALGHISQRVITSITDTTSIQAVACNRVWSLSLKDCLSLNDWNFARVTVLLVASATYDPTINDWLYAYKVPDNCIQVRSVFNSYTKNKDLGEKYLRMFDPTVTPNENLILTNVGGDTTQDYAYARFTYNVTDPTLFDPCFIASYGYRLAAWLCPILVGDNAKTEALMKLSEAALSDSQRTNSYEGTTNTDTGNPTVQARA